MFVFVVVSHFGFEGGTVVLITSVHVHYIYFTFENGRNKNFIVYPCKPNFCFSSCSLLIFQF